tara:strand:+ start:6450 stop:6800 length:351 start_codon:yes stop_codon:yes gene_type:complete
MLGVVMRLYGPEPERMTLLDRAIRMIRKEHLITRSMLLRGGRDFSISHVRHELWALLHTQGLHPEVIARITGGFDRSTVIYGIGQAHERRGKQHFIKMGEDLEQETKECRALCAAV